MGNPLGKGGVATNKERLLPRRRVGEAAGNGRTFNRTSTSIPDTYWSSLSVSFCHTLKMSNQSPSEDLKNGLPMPVYTTIGLIYLLKYGSLRPAYRTGSRSLSFYRVSAYGTNIVGMDLCRFSEIIE